MSTTAYYQAKPKIIAMDPLESARFRAFKAGLRKAAETRLGLKSPALEAKRVKPVCKFTDDTLKPKTLDMGLFDYLAFVSVIGLGVTGTFALLAWSMAFAFTR